MPQLERQILSIQLMVQHAQKYNDVHTENGQFGFAGGGGGSGGGGTVPMKKTLESLGVHPQEKWVKEYHHLSDTEKAKYAAAHSMTLEEYTKAADAKAQAMVDRATLYTRVKPAVLLKVLNNGRFKSQFETHTTGGSIAFDVRNKFEQDVFSFDSAKSPVAERPVYGYVTSAADGASTGWSDVAQFGNVALTLDPAVRVRTTVSVGDSLKTTIAGNFPMIVPRPLEKPTGDIYGYGLGIDPLTSYPVERYNYLETQIHGGLAASDITSAAFHGKAPGVKLQGKLKELGIPFTVIPKGVVS